MECWHGWHPRWVLVADAEMGELDGHGVAKFEDIFRSPDDGNHFLPFPTVYKKHSADCHSACLESFESASWVIKSKMSAQ